MALSNQLRLRQPAPQGRFLGQLPPVGIQARLYEAIDRLFFESDDEVFAESFSDYAESADKGHGREERRCCWVCYDMSTLQGCAAVWKGLEALVVIESHRTVGGQTTQGNRSMKLLNCRKKCY